MVEKQQHFDLVCYVEIPSVSSGAQAKIHNKQMEIKI
jgi:hypothetical protein